MRLRFTGGSDYIINLNPHAKFAKTSQELLSNSLELVELAKKKCPPPRQWDGMKKLPWPVDIYYKGKRYDVVAYNLDDKRFAYKNKDGMVFEVPNADFLVQRRH